MDPAMQDSQYSRRLRFTRREYEELLDRLDARTTAADLENRVRERFEFRVADIPLTIEHPDGGTSHFLTLGRNISRSGIGLLHGGFVHRGSGCEILLDQIDGSPITVRGEVRHCRLVAGSCHEIGVHFHEEIDPSRLRGSAESLGAEATKSEAGFQKIQGSILLSESFDPDRDLLEHHLSMFGLDLTTVSTPGATLDAIKTQEIDLVLYGLPLSGTDGLRTVELIRKEGVTAPILVMTAETDGAILNEARTSGATSIIAKPYYLDLLVAQLQVHLSHDDHSRPLYSTMADQSGMPPLIKSYVDTVKRIAGQVERAQIEGETQELIEYVRQLKGSGCCYGFQNITVTAIGALGALDADPTSDRAKEAVKAVIESCRAVEFNQSMNDVA
jgi:DNA-binding response OmpR family regulator